MPTPEARLERLERRIDDLERRFNDVLESLAEQWSAVVARIKSEAGAATSSKQGTSAKPQGKSAHS